MNAEFFYKLIRGVIFPFRFGYLVFYQWRVRRKKGMISHPPLL